MDCELTKRYIKLTEEFQATDGSQKSIEGLYDLLEIVKTKDDEKRLLANIYSKLKLHKSAYETFKTVANSSNKKDKIKLFTLKQSAKFGDTECFKDIRKLRGEKKQTVLSKEDIKLCDEKMGLYEIVDEGIVIFNKYIKNDIENGRVQIYVDDDIYAFADKIINHIYFLGKCKQNLINYYNEQEISIFEEKADEDWFDTLEVYSISLELNGGEIYSDISCGDELFSDHILEIGFKGEEVVSMSYDG